jgi:DNA polymerase (family 10)
MTNKQIAKQLRDYADLLAIKGENPFRINAFQRAAGIINHLPESARDLVEAGAITEIAGIGPGIASALEEIVRTGRYSVRDQLASEMPDTLLTLLGITGLGPKTVGRLYRELGITNVSELEAAAKRGRLRQLKGLGVRAEERILDGIAFLNRRTNRYSLGIALTASELIASRLGIILDTRVEIAGGVRRMAETVGNIDLIARIGDAALVRDGLSKIAEVAEVESGGGTFVAASLENGIRLRVAVAPPHRFGTDWVIWTGSSGHVAELGRRSGGQLPLKADEDAVYHALGLQWIAPELRESRGEIEASREGRLPKLVTLADLRGDLQLHSEWSDGNAPIFQLAIAARERGYEYLSITDHSAGLGIARGLSIERLKEQWREIERVNELVPEVRLLRSSEVEVHADGTLDFPDELLAQLDIVVASLHSGLRQPAPELTARMLTALRNPNVDIIAHPTGRIMDRRPGAAYDWDAVFQVARETGTALEIDGDPARLDLNDELARAAMNARVLLSIDSDAHSPDSLSATRFGIGVARRAWVSPDSVVNTRPLADLLNWLGRAS